MRYDGDPVWRHDDDCSLDHPCADCVAADVARAAHALQHVVAGMLRKFGGPTRTIVLEEECLAGHHRFEVRVEGDGVMRLRLLDEESVDAAYPHAS